MVSAVLSLISLSTCFVRGGLTMSALLTPAAGVATVVPPLATKLVVEPWLPSSVTAVLLSSVLAATVPCVFPTS